MYMPFKYPWSLLVIAWLLLVPTNITGISGEPTVLEGNNLQLICAASSHIEPNITWTKEKPGYQGNTSVVQEGKVLNITNINRSDAGAFTCTAALVSQRTEPSVWMLLVSMHWRQLWLMLNRDALLVSMYHAVNYLLNSWTCLDITSLIWAQIGQWTCHACNWTV